MTHWWPGLLRTVAGGGGWQSTVVADGDGSWLDMNMWHNVLALEGVALCVLHFDLWPHAN
ncbi:unnamed protein product [Prunus armeniaca]